MTAATPQQVCERLEEVVEDWPGSPEFKPDSPATDILCSAVTSQGTIAFNVIVLTLEEGTPGRRAFTQVFDVPPELEGGAGVQVTGNIMRQR